MRHIPYRSCIICGCRAEKAKLARIVKGSMDTVVLDSTGHLPGRGAYVCELENCWDRAVLGGAVIRALKLGRDEQICDRLVDIRRERRKLSESPL